VCRAQTKQEEALKMAQDLLAKGMDAAKNVDVNAMKAQATQAAQMSAATVKSAVDAGLAAWSSYDKDGDGKLSIAEAVDMLNGPEISGAIQQATGQPHTKRTEADIKAWFQRADFDKSCTLSKREFAVMYAGVLCEKAAGNASVLSNGLLSAIKAAGGDGKIEVSELKNLLGLVGLRKA
jgi:Ca2+-binding EF-hand superfamily protein